MTMLKIAIQGFEGSFHHMAAVQYFKQPLQLAQMASFSKLFSAIADDKSIDMAVMAIENSIAGSILQNYQLLRKSSLFMVGEIYMPIQQNLLTLAGVKMDDLEEVHSHPMAILQCEDFFADYPDIRLIESEDTALSAKKLSKKRDTKHGAIASKLAAELYHLEVLKESIETVKNNFTRFLVLSRDKPAIYYGDKASIHFLLDNSPRALLRALQVIGDKGLNISKIQSIPEVAREWRYYFHLDLEFDDLESFNGAIEELKKVTHELRIFGVYKKGISIGSDS